MPIVSVTRLHLRSIRFLPPFFWYKNRSLRQAKQTSGNLGVRLRKTKGLAFWTLSMWENNEAMRAFIVAPPHKEAMRRLPHWCDEASFADWQQNTAHWPPWEQAADKLSGAGRLASVLHPSAQHKAGNLVTS
jgi:heme-degrading monooxygenase HmoA